MVISKVEPYNHIGLFNPEHSPELFLSFMLNENFPHQTGGFNLMVGFAGDPLWQPAGP